MSVKTGTSTGIKVRKNPQESPVGTGLSSSINAMIAHRRFATELGELSRVEEHDILVRLLQGASSESPRSSRRAADSTIFSVLLRYLSHRKETVEKELDLLGVEADLRPEYLDVGQISQAYDNRDAFRRSKDQLLAHFLGKYVAFCRGKLLAADDSFGQLAARLRDMRLSDDVCVGLVNEAAFGSSAPTEMPGLHECALAKDPNHALAEVLRP